MARYLLLASYSAEGAKGVAASGMAARRDSVRAAFEAIGGTLLAMDVVAGGTWDFAIQCEMADSASVKAMLMATMGTGGFRDPPCTS